MSSGAAIANRRPGAKVDVYCVKLEFPEDSVAKKVKQGFNGLLEKLKATKDACAKIAAGQGLVEKQSSSDIEKDVLVKVSGVYDTVIFFNRKAADFRKISNKVDEGIPACLSVFPRQGSGYLELMKLSTMSFNPLIPVINNVDDSIDPNNVNVPCKGIVFFEMKQTAFQTSEKEGRVKEIRSSLYCGS